MGKEVRVLLSPREKGLEPEAQTGSFFETVKGIDEVREHRAINIFVGDNDIPTILTRAFDQQRYKDHPEVLHIQLEARLEVENLLLLGMVAKYDKGGPIRRAKARLGLSEVVQSAKAPPNTPEADEGPEDVVNNWDTTGTVYRNGDVELEATYRDPNWDEGTFERQRYTMTTDEEGRKVVHLSIFRYNFPYGRRLKALDFNLFTFTLDENDYIKTVVRNSDGRRLDFEPDPENPGKFRFATVTAEAA